MRSRNAITLIRGRTNLAHTRKFCLGAHRVTSVVKRLADVLSYKTLLNQKMQRIAKFLCYVSFCVLLLSIVFFIGKGCFPYGYWHPVIAGDPMIFDVGLVETDAPVPCEFCIKNVGNRPLLIEEIAPECGSGGFIQLASLSAATLQPGEIGTIVVSFHPARLQGNVQKQITVKTNDPVTPMFLLSVQACVELPVAARVRASGACCGRNAEPSFAMFRSPR